MTTSNLNKSKWPQEHVDALRKFMGDGESSHAQVTAALNKRFGTDYSRNSIIGKATRLGIPSNIAPYGEGRGKSKTQPTEPKIRIRKLAPAFVRNPLPDVSALRCVEIEPRHVSLHDLKFDDCRWPYGERLATTYCGHPAVFGSYCGPHYALSVGPGTSSEQAAHRVSRRVA